MGVARPNMCEISLVVDTGEMIVWLECSKCAYVSRVMFDEVGDIG